MRMLSMRGSETVGAPDVTDLVDGEVGGDPGVDPAGATGVSTCTCLPPCTACY